MAQSLAHKFGQIVGNVPEAAIERELATFAVEHRLYLDKKGHRPARVGRKVTWMDQFGNTHDLDCVLERSGTEDVIGTPVAFIETAWRRYTKHSRNKAQEIQGAIQALALTHRSSFPFTGAVLAGVFTGGALNQLKSLGFQILFFSYESIIDAFQSVGLDAKFDEDTPEKEFRKKISRWNTLSKRARQKVADRLIGRHKKDVETFLAALQKTVSRQISKIIIIPLHGSEMEYTTVAEAIDSLSSYGAESVVGKVYKYEIQIRYNNGDKITAEFSDKAGALEFLAKYSS
jgi:hypothetical protein